MQITTNSEIQHEIVARNTHNIPYGQDSVETSTRSDCHKKMNDLRHRIANKIRLNSTPFLRECLAEMVGTCVLIIYGCGVIAQVELGSYGKSAHGDFMSISLGWGMAVTLGVYFAGAGGPGLINPAVTLAFAIIGKIKFQKVIPYTISQVLGAFFGAILVFVVYYESIIKYSTNGADGLFLMNHTGKIFVTLPNKDISNLGCFIDQIFGTMLLAGCALAIIDKNSWNMPKFLHPLAIGLMIYPTVGAYALNAGAALNPARDLGPRIMLLLFGWGSSSFTAYNYFFWIPIIGPYVGASLGAILYEVLIGIHIDGAGDPSIADNKHDRVIVVKKGPRDEAKDDEHQTLLRMSEVRM